MSSEGFIQLFKVLGVLFVVSVLLLVVNIFLKKRYAPALRFIIVLVAIASFIGMLAVVIGNAKSVVGVAERAYQNDIYNIIFYSLTFLLRATIFGIMIGLFVYLIKKSLAFPKLPVFVLHKILLVLGIVGILIVFVYDVKLAVEDRKYAEVISFGKYGIIFIGSMFWMMLCSVLAAAALPEPKN